ncbi:MAG: HEAT repeat domain-containing protein [bacterium]|nr:HEAT repeat domain-containing protein [bacterium]
MLQKKYLCGKIVFYLLFFLIATFGCAVRRVPPLRYVPVLGSKPDTSMEGILKRALDDKNPMVRRDAVRLLGTMISTPEEQRRSAAALNRALGDKEEDIRLEAVKALGKIAPEISGPYLSRAMSDKSVRVRIQVVQVLRDAYQRQAGQVETVSGG